MVSWLRSRGTKRPISTALLASAAILTLAMTAMAFAASASSSEHVRRVAPGIDMLDVARDGRPVEGATILHPAMSADGHHVGYGFDVGNAREIGLVWRDLRSGRTIRLGGMPFYPYALAISGTGRYVVYSAAATIASNGYVTGTSVWLWDTKTNRRRVIERLPSGKMPSDGSTFGVDISDNGRWIVFDSSSKQLAPPGAIEDPGNTETNSYVYLYDRVRKRLTALPWRSEYEEPTAFRYPVISGDGRVVAFHNGLEAPEIWYPASGSVRAVPSANETGATDGEGLALSSDGSVLANSAAGVSVVALGESAETDRLTWSEPRPETTTGSVALSADGSLLAFLGGEPAQDHTKQRIWIATLPGGTARPLPLAPSRRSLPPAPKPIGGLALNTVTMSADGRAVATVMCSRGYKRPDQCSSRMDFFRWRIGPAVGG